LAGELDGIVRLHSKESEKSLEIDQRYVIKFFIDEGMKQLDILMHLHKHYGPRALSRSTLYFWIGEARRDRTDLSEIPGPGRTPDEGLATVIARRHEQDRRLSAQKLMQSLGISSTHLVRFSLIRDLTESVRTRLAHEKN
jgi:hypothetical protein